MCCDVMERWCCVDCEFSLVYLLGGHIEVNNVAVDEGCQIVGSGLDGVSLLGDGELLDELLERLEALGGLLGRHFWM